MSPGTNSGASNEEFNLGKSDLNLIFTNPDGRPPKPDSISASVSNLFRKLRLPKPEDASLHLLCHPHGSHLLARASRGVGAAGSQFGDRDPNSILISARIISKMYNMPEGNEE
jgi:hypothetical protein